MDILHSVKPPNHQKLLFNEFKNKLKQDLDKGIFSKNPLYLLKEIDKDIKIDGNNQACINMLQQCKETGKF